MNFVLHIYQTITYRSFRFCKLVALSFGFFALASFFFWALSRSCSRWFPPRAPRYFDGERTEQLKERINKLGTYGSLVVDTEKNGFEREWVAENN